MNRKRVVAILVSSSLSLASASAVAGEVHPGEGGEAQAKAPAAGDAPAADETPSRRAKSLIEGQLVNPLAERERSVRRFSRAARPPTGYQVRIVDASTQVDGQGRKYLTFTVDALHAWSPTKETPGVYTGCVYLDTQQVYVKRGSSYRDAATYLQKKGQTSPVEGVCAPSGSV